MNLNSTENTSHKGSITFGKAGMSLKLSGQSGQWKLLIEIEDERYQSLNALLYQLTQRSVMNPTRMKTVLDALASELINGDTS